MQGTTGPRTPAHRLSMMAGILLVIAGCLVLFLPLVGSGASWTWNTKTLSNLEGAKINAMPQGTNSDGVRLAPQGTRPVSLISAPLMLGDDVGRIVEVAVSLPDAETPSMQTVNFLWQVRTLDKAGKIVEPENYQFEPTQAMLGKAVSVVRFSVTVPPEDLHRIGFQFPEAEGIVVIGRIAFPTLTFGERVSLAASQAIEGEPFAAHSINFLRGPSILGNSVNSLLMALVAIGAGIALLVAALRRRRVCAAVLVGLVIGVWAIEDARATLNLNRNATEEVERFAKAEKRVDVWMQAHGSYEIAWAADLLVENADPGLRFCVVSDDTFTVPHRLAYLVAPRLSIADDCKEADFIVVMFSSRARFDPDTQILTMPDDSMIDARPVAQLSDYCYILRRSAK